MVRSGPQMYLALITAGGVAALVLATYAWSVRRSPGFAHLALTQAATAWWIGCYLGEHLDATNAVAWFPWKFPAVAAIPPAWLLFAMHQIGTRPAARTIGLAYAWPIALVVVMSTNGWHHLMFLGVTRGAEVIGTAGPLFALHVVLSYAMFIAAEVLLFGDWWRHGSRHALLLGIGGLIPFGGNVLFELALMIPAIGRYVQYDTTLPAFTLSALFTGWAALRHQMLDAGPIARNTLFGWLPDLVIVLSDEGTVVDVNRAALDALDVHEREIVGRAWADVVAAHEWLALPRSHGATVERRGRRHGLVVWYEIQSRRLTGPHGRDVGTLVVARDVSVRHDIEARLRAESRRDELTGLANRRAFEDEAARLRASREFPVALFAFDLDGLKQVNDRDGHAAGDSLLREMAGFLTRVFREGDRVVRLGGDEFLVVLPSTSRAEADVILQRLPEALHQVNRQRTHPLRFSVGVAIAEDAASWPMAMAAADQRLYEDKRNRLID